MVLKKTGMFRNAMFPSVKKALGEILTKTKVNWM